ncbi:Protein Y45G12B.2 a [Aphelenchoides avenae]|nr:Protein Y45G12B.2 a [Aphelenchus avenae]
MGLCKCPKRKVTQLFCFEHRVNVCESCLVSSHESCVVQTYLSWLTDSDYDPNCLLCAEPLPSKETVRLKCLHVFHWSCLNARAGQLPETTTPAGYKCPACLDVIFPSPNQTSPVVDQLRQKLGSVNWGRVGLGLDSLPFDTRASPSPMDHHSASAAHAAHQHQPSAPSPHAYNGPSFAVNMDNAGGYQPTMAADMASARFTSRAKGAPSSETVSLLRSNSNSLDDDSKYAKKQTERSSFRFSRTPRSVKRVLVAVLVIGMVYLAFIILGRSDESLDSNPLFDPHANPNIRIEAKDPI